ncbi:hypothetical protein BASA81_007719 [Batrachochytrium salamandrivorans]|nr:hypothetical protein BASA81_007719 [Batrachochytrium salamandrivorans]
MSSYVNIATCNTISDSALDEHSCTEYAAHAKIRVTSATALSLEADPPTRAKTIKAEPIFAIKAVHLPGSVGIGLPIRTTFLLYQKVLRLLDHPHINPYLGWTVIETEGQVYSAYCNGGTLRQAVYKNESDPGIKDIETVKRWIYQIVSALVYLHDHGMVHRDIKPDNILLHNGECRISDLGSSRLHQHCCCDPHQKKISGTPAYTPPEAVTSQIAFDTCAEDIWGVGCCLYEMVMGESPWSDCDGVFSIYFTLGSFIKRYTDSSDTLHDQSGVCREPPRDEGLSGDPDTDSASDDGDDNGGFSGHPLVERAAARGDLDSDGIDFLKACLEWDPYQRPLAIQLLQMPFLASVGK